MEMDDSNHSSTISDNEQSSTNTDTYQYILDRINDIYNVNYSNFEQLRDCITAIDNLTSDPTYVEILKKSMENINNDFLSFSFVDAFYKDVFTSSQAFDPTHFSFEFIYQTLVRMYDELLYFFYSFLSKDCHENCLKEERSKSNIKMYVYSGDNVKNFLSNQPF
ncbi:hypothetical protein QTN25_000380 [Entamoeba marina]